MLESAAAMRHASAGVRRPGKKSRFGHFRLLGHLARREKTKRLAIQPGLNDGAEVVKYIYNARRVLSQAGRRLSLTCDASRVGKVPCFVALLGCCGSPVFFSPPQVGL